MNIHVLISSETSGPSARLSQLNRQLSPIVETIATHSGVTPIEEQHSSREKIEPAVTLEQINAASREAAWTISNFDSTPDLLLLMTSTGQSFMDECGLGDDIFE